MSPSDTQVILKYLISKLDPADLEELDGMLDGEAEPMASDARLGSEQQRKDWISMGHKARIAARSGFRNRMAQDSAGHEEFSKLFPHAARLK